MIGDESRKRPGGRVGANHLPSPEPGPHAVRPPPGEAPARLSAGLWAANLAAVLPFLGLGAAALFLWGWGFSCGTGSTFERTTPFKEEIMSQRSKAITLDVDPESLAQLRQALPGGDFQTADGATADLLERDWKLVVVGARARPGEALGLCRGLRSQAGRAHTPLLVLVPVGQETLVRAVLAAGADHCLVLPVRGAALARVTADARAEDHERRLDQDRYASAWQDDGGEG